jgi:hypothetical protein
MIDKCSDLVENTEEKIELFGRFIHIWGRRDIRTDLKERGFVGINWIPQGQV